MYAVYRQTDPPTTIDQAVYCHFTNTLEKELVVSGGSFLRVYRLNPFVTVSKPAERLATEGEIPSNIDEGESIPSTETITKLECILQIPLYGNIVSLGAGKLPKTTTDSLFLAFDEAKLSVVQYDPDEHGLKIISLHCFEDDLLRAGFTKRNAAGASSVLRVDPGDRCAAMLTYGRHLAIVPFSRETGLFGDELETPTAPQATAPKREPAQLGTPSTTSTTAPYLHSFSVPLDQIDPRLQNVADFCFLHGYHEPTILFLFEPVQTTSGRLAVRQDTLCILAVSLNVKDRIYAVIWTVNGLPFDCFRCLAVPKPVGGVVVFAVNSAIYLNQSVPAVGVVLNAAGRESSAFPLRTMEDKRIQLDGCHADFLTPNTLMVSLRNGDLYVVTLLVDNMNAVKGFHFDKSQSSVIPSVARKCTEGYMFLGSRLGNSLLLKYTETNSFAMKVATSGVPEAKRQRLEDENGDPTYGESPYAKLEDDLELYGEVVAVGTVESTRVSQYAFDVCDSILNIGPIRQCVFGEPETVSVEYHNKMDPIVDLVTASGHGKNGCMVVLQRSVRPQVLTTNVIPGGQRLWAVGLPNESEFDLEKEKNQGEGEEGGQKEKPLAGSHQHLLLSKEVMTMALELKAEISELESSGFIMNQRTVAAGNIGNGRYVVQVTPMIVALLEGSRKVQHLALDLDFPISQASIADPYVALLTENGELLLLTLLPDASYEYYELVISQPEIYQNVPATSICAYKDASGIFDVNDSSANEILDDPYGDAIDNKTAAFSVPATKPKIPFATSLASADIDDEDALLYGDEGKSEAASNVKSEPIFNRRDPRFDDVLFEGSGRRRGAKGSQCIDPSTVMPTFWLAVTRENGLLEIFRLPDFHLVYMVKKFPVGFKTLFDTDPIKLALEQDKLDEKFPPVQELLLVGLGANKSRPHLFAIVDEELLIYEAFPYVGQQKVSEHLCLRFRRLSHSAQLRNSKVQRTFRRRPDGTLYGGMQNFNDPQLRLYYFDDVSGYSGVFVAGAYPFWFFMTSQGMLRCHPMHLDGKVLGFSPFHNVNCHRGFMYLNEKREMRICQLPAHISYDASCPAHKVNLKNTAHHIVYHLDSRTYAVTISEKVPSKTMVTMVSDEKQVDILDKEDPNFIYPCIDKFKVQLYSSETWEPIPEAEILFDEFEHVTVMKEVQLKSEGTRSGLENYLAMGTIYNYGEEVMVRGRIFIAEVVEVVPEPDKPLTKNKLKILYSQEQKGPVTSLCSLQGYLLTGMGPKVYIWSFKDNDLQGISFLDLQIYIHSMISIRNIALVGDVFRSVCLLRYQENSKALSLASRDTRHLEVYSMEFLIDNKLLGFLISDADGNVYVYTYQPEAKESLGGQKLVRRADMNAGARINAFARIRCHVGDAVVEKKMEAGTRQLTLFGTLDGAMGYFLPLPEKVYRRLLMLQNILLTGIQHEAGLNPKAYRSVRQQGNILFNPQKNILDGDLLFTYSNLSLTEKADFAKRIGTTREQLQDDLLEIERMATHF